MTPLGRVFVLSDWNHTCSGRGANGYACWAQCAETITLNAVFTRPTRSSSRLAMFSIFSTIRSNNIRTKRNPLIPPRLQTMSLWSVWEPWIHCQHFHYMFLQSSSILAKKVLYWLAEQTLAALPLRLSVIRNMLEENLHSTIVLLLDSSLQSLMQPRLRKSTPQECWTGPRNFLIARLCRQITGSTAVYYSGCG